MDLLQIVKVKACPLFHPPSFFTTFWKLMFRETKCNQAHNPNMLFMDKAVILAKFQKDRVRFVGFSWPHYFGASLIFFGAVSRNSTTKMFID